MTNQPNNQFATITEPTTMHLTFAPPAVDCGIDGTVCDDMGMARFIADALNAGFAHDGDATAYDCDGMAVVVMRNHDDNRLIPYTAFTMNNAFTTLLRMGYALTWGDDLPPHVTDDDAPYDAADPRWIAWTARMIDHRTRATSPW